MISSEAGWNLATVTDGYQGQAARRSYMCNRCKRLGHSSQLHCHMAVQSQLSSQRKIGF